MSWYSDFRLPKHLTVRPLSFQSLGVPSLARLDHGLPLRLPQCLQRHVFDQALAEFRSRFIVQPIPDVTLPDSAERASGLVLGSDCILEKALTAACNARDSAAS